MSCVLVVMDAGGLASLAIVKRIAAGTGAQLAVVCASKSEKLKFDEVKPDASEMSDLVRVAHEALGASDTERIPVYECLAPILLRGVLDALSELHARRLILPVSVSGGSDASKALTKKLAKRAPLDTVVVDVGDLSERPIRVVVPQLRGGGSHAIRFGGRCFGANGTPMVVLGEPEAASRSRRVFERALERLPEGAKVTATQRIAGGPLEKSLGEEIQPGDLVVLDAEKPGRVSAIVARLSQLRKDKAGASCGIALVRPVTAAGPGRWERAYERFRAGLPKLSRDERRHVHETLERGGRVSTDFMVMLVLSAAIAAFGLIQSSTATVIGAMLVAPLMTPLLAIAMALVQGNARLFSHAWRALAVGIVGALLAAMAIGMTSPWQDLSAEVVARSGPNPFDLGTAFLSGMAAAFALARAGLAGTLVGVAIAVALVPPLSVIGIAVVKSEFGVAVGASVLFLTNLLSIILGAFVVFRVFGLDVSGKGKRAPRWVIVTLAIVVLAFIPTTSVLFKNLDAQRRQGVHRPYSRPLPPNIRERLTARVAEEPGVEIVFMAESEIEHGFGREVAILSSGEFDSAFVDELREILRGGEGNDVAARVIVLQGAEVREKSSE